MGQSFRGNYLSLHRTLDGRHVSARPRHLNNLSSVICHAKTGYWLVGACRALDLLDPSASFRSSRGTRSSIG